MSSGEDVCVVGLGYVGLTFALSLCEVGFKVLGIEKNKQVREDLLEGNPHFYEEGLQELLKKHVRKNLNVYDRIPDNRCNIYISTVGTPLDKDKKAVLLDVEASIRSIGRFIKKKDTLILRSTIPVGVSRKIVLPILEEVSGLKGGEDFYFIYSPERTLEGAALKEIRTLPQVISGVSQESIVKATDFFKQLTPIVIPVSSLEAAEMIKIMDNTYRDLKFAIANEFALICEVFNLDAFEIIKAANFKYERSDVAYPSPGVGGPCLTKDPYFLIDSANRNKYVANLIREARRLNEYMPYHVAEKVRQFLEYQNKPEKRAKIFVLGFGFKGHPLTSDVRESPTRDLVRHLKKFVKNIYGFDLLIQKKTIEEMGAIPCDIEQGFQDADCVIFMLNSQFYKDLDIISLVKSTRKPAYIYDGWQIFNPHDLKNIDGIFYGGMGFGWNFSYGW